MAKSEIDNQIQYLADNITPFPSMQFTTKGECTMTEEKKPTESTREKTAERTTEKQPDGTSKTTEKEVTKKSESKPDND